MGHDAPQRVVTGEIVGGPAGPLTAGEVHTGAPVQRGGQGRMAVDHRVLPQQDELAPGVAAGGGG